jgi:nickel-type superoxide dismutase maturation protease
MLPALRPGDWWVVRRGGPIRPGDVVVVERPDRPGLLVVKRVVRRAGDGWWVEGDNPAESDDSRQFGPVPAQAVRGRVVWRYFPIVRRRGR